MESGGGARVRRQLQAVGRVAAYLGGGFLLLSAASTAAVRSLRYLSDANQVTPSPKAPTHPNPEGQILRGYPCHYSDQLVLLPEEIRDALWFLRGEGNLRVQALQGQLHGGVVTPLRPGVYQPLSLPYL
jgi:hypothetical protein